MTYEQKIEYAFDAIASAKTAIECVPPSRERSLTQTKLDEAQMWFQRSIPPINKEAQ